MTPEEGFELYKSRLLFESSKMNVYAVASNALFGAGNPINLPLFNRNTSLVVDRAPSELVLNSTGVPTLTLETLLPYSPNKTKPIPQTATTNVPILTVTATMEADDNMWDSDDKPRDHTEPQMPISTVASFNITRGINSTVGGMITQTPLWTQPTLDGSASALPSIPFEITKMRNITSRPRPRPQSSERAPIVAPVSLPAEPQVSGLGGGSDNEGEGEGDNGPTTPDQLPEPYPPSPGPEKPLPPTPRKKTRGGSSSRI
ncbi:hypothetical protein F5X99DRAFT_404915 [Biscogniauxia marginata]|nr:hypothetical protein F5X99DRAFT_404915 [Biscogniauxia marginata]